MLSPKRLCQVLWFKLPLSREKGGGLAKKGLLVSADDQIRYESVQSYLQGEISLLELASVLQLTERQTYRVVAKVRKNGLKGVFHGNHGRVPINKISPFLKKRVQEIVRTTYFDFNCLHMQERLRDDLQLDIKRETLRSWCKEIGVAKNKRRTRRKPRSTRQRHCNRGFLLQMDGSHHEWVAGQEWVLISIIDDATSELHYCQFHYGETTNACLAGLRAVIERFGIPRFIYVDRAGLYGGQKRQNFSEFERACNELGIKIIYANSPQGKGRIERSFRTFQDRLIPELRHRKITDMGKANLFLNDEFIPKQWGQFTVEPASALEDWRSIPDGLDLNKVFSILKHRKVNPGETISLDAHSLRVAHPEKISLAGQTVELRFDLQGRMTVWFAGTELKWERVRNPQRIRARGVA
ncbi:MAG: hypothetical protein RL189_955 [Pseudomonadota bacterium]